MKEFIQKVSQNIHLTREEARSAMRVIMEGKATEAQIASLLMGLKLKGERAEELLGFVDVMREMSIKIRVNDPDAIDMCGTGGDGTATFNVSTVASFVVAGAGVTVAKHGNRSISSACGSADLLKALCVNIDLPPSRVEECINSVGIGFLFAPLFHPAMKYAAKPRTEMGVKTCFNILGPMTNPAGIRRQLVGAYDPDVARLMAAVFSSLNPLSIFVIHGEEGMDEASLECPTKVFELGKSSVPQEYTIGPNEFGLGAVHRNQLLGGTPDQNASIALAVLRGEKGPHRNIVVANAALGLLVAGKASGIRDGVTLASESLDSGKALQSLIKLQAFTTV